MSLAALLKAMRKNLRAEVPLADSECDVMPDGRPVIGFGKRFVAIHPVRWYPPGNIVVGLREFHDITCTITQRCLARPKDKFMSDLYLDHLQGLEQLARKITKVVHQSQTLMGVANDWIEGEDWIINPLVWAGTDAAPQVVGADWVGSAGQPEERAALVVGVHFREAERVQCDTHLE